MDIKELKENLARDLLSLGYVLYDVSYEKKDSILHIVIDKKMDLNEVESISQKLSKIMDMYDEDFPEYLLDVSSVGLEKEIRNIEELKEAVGSYIYLSTDKLKIYGDLMTLDDDKVLTLVTKEKNISKTLKIAYQDVKKVRYAVKF